MRDMVEVLLSWQSSNKNHFKAKVCEAAPRNACKKCGLDAVKYAMPEEHMKLLTNIRKVEQMESYENILGFR
ncbi:hypothetical protein HanPSC8_Chr10g0408681 [Helianthus annuus]|nr:hypothetical protein HanPSC8_Chr10g0408681 [Helianthus annuus]